MAFMDKVKAQAEQVIAKAQQGVAQGQVKLETYQASRNADAVLRELGRAFYAGQRTGGSSDALDAALAAVDAYVAANGPIDPVPGAHGEAPVQSAPAGPAPLPATEAAAPAPLPATEAAPPPAAAPGGSTLDHQ
jgi:hypothetical protein